MTIKTKKEIELFFKKLTTACREKATYSVIETAEKMGIDYKLIKKWARLDKIFSDALEFCRMCCACNAETDALKMKIPSEKGLKYMCENDDEFKKKYEKQKTIELQEKLEREGKEIPSSKKNSKPEFKMNKKITENTKKPITNIQETEQYTDIEKKRIQAWRRKETKGKLSFKYQATTKRNKNHTIISANFNKQNLTQYQKVELHNSTISTATGSASFEYSPMLLNKTLNSVFKPENQDYTFTVNAIHEALLALEPKDEIEGMLCSRLIVLHDQSMEFISRTTGSEQTMAGIDMNINRSTKLMRLYNETLEALNRYRRKGEQKVTVQHVNVNSGGQAIVGSKINNQGGGVHEEK